RIISRGIKEYAGAVLITLFLFPVSGESQQNTYTSEGKLLKQADKYFKAQDFAGAFPLYSQLVSLYPKDPNYNYRYGACMLFTRADKEKPLIYLEYAVKDPTVEVLAFYYLGRAYHLNYLFNKAIASYTRFNTLASASEKKDYPVAHL